MWLGLYHQHVTFPSKWEFTFSRPIKKNWSWQCVLFLNLLIKGLKKKWCGSASLLSMYSIYISIYTCLYIFCIFWLFDLFLQSQKYNHDNISSKVIYNHLLRVTMKVLYAIFLQKVQNYFLYVVAILLLILGR